VAALVVAAGLGAGYVFVYLPGTNRPPVANISATSLAPATYQIVIFNGSGSTDPDGDPLSFGWRFSDGPVLSGVVVNRTFLTVGTFTVTLTVTDSHGAAANATKTVTTHPAPLRVGTNTPYPPFEFYSTTGVLVGFDIDLADAIATRLAYSAVWSNVADFNVLLSDVRLGAVDMAASAIQSSGSVGASRNTTIAFSNPYYKVLLPVLVRSSNNLTCPGSACTPAALANRTVAVVSGTVSEMWVRDNLVATNRTPSRDVLIFAGEGSAITALRSGTVELGIFDSLAGFGNLANLSLRLAGTIATGILYSLAFPRTAEGLALRDRVNTVLQALILDGTYAMFYQRWFGP
jgi:ABC-type amino acid transport substrate-binding protein